ncbi:DNA repair protein RadC [Candidatus Saccharibacteria bacterium]|nr:MAG: DNA repair protein RadC [Candidatus Saccharibacteria bacterium]
MTRMTDKRPSDRPREKLARKGPAALTDLELLQALIGSGNAQADVTQIARTILKLLKRDRELTQDALEHVKGIGPAKLSELLAGFELARRYLLEPDRPIIDSPASAVEQLDDIRDKKQEYFVCLTLDGANRLIAKRVITIGTLTSSLVHPREVFAPAIEDRAASIIVAHNHPSGSLEASQADRQVTTRIKEASELLGITLLEHVIVTKDSFTTIKIE